MSLFKLTGQWSRTSVSVGAGSWLDAWRRTFCWICKRTDRPLAEDPHRKAERRRTVMVCEACWKKANAPRPVGSKIN